MPIARSCITARTSSLIVHALYLVVLLSNRSAFTRRQYLQHPLIQSYITLVILHITLFLFIFMSISLKTTPPLMAVFMFICHMCVSVYPLQHAYVAYALRRAP